MGETSPQVKKKVQKRGASYVAENESYPPPPTKLMKNSLQADPFVQPLSFPLAGKSPSSLDATSNSKKKVSFSALNYCGT